MNLKKVDDIIQKCDICLGKAVISDEYIMESFLGFLTGTVSDENCSGRGIALHINSPCFMAVAVVWAAFSTILGNGMDVDQIVRSLRMDDSVIYNNKRGQFKGIEIRDGIERVCIFQEGGKKASDPQDGQKLHHIMVNRQDTMAEESVEKQEIGKNFLQNCLTVTKMKYRGLRTHLSFL